VNAQGPASGRDEIKRRRSLPWGLIILVLVGGIGIAFGVRWWLSVRSHVTTDDAAVEATVLQVAPKIGGRVLQVLAATGDRVAPGQVLVRLESNDLEASVHKAEAAAAAKRKDVLQAETALGFESKDVASQNAKAEAVVSGSDLRVRQAVTAASLEEQRVTNQLRQARAALAAAEADRAKAQADLGRMEKLFSQGAVSAQQRDEAKNAETDTRARVEAAQAAVALAEAERAQIAIKQQDIAASRAASREAKAALSSARAARLQVGVRRAQLEAAVAQVKQADQELRLAQIALQNAEIPSPAAGVITQRLVEPGEMVAVGQPLFTITQEGARDDTWVVANLEETQVGRVRVGDSAAITVDAYPGLVLRGRVVEIRAGTQAQFSLIPAQQTSGSFTKVTQRVPVKIALDGDSGVRLVPGMSVVVSIDVGRRSGQRRATGAPRTTASPRSADLGSRGR
jgi:membrane fusion protein (multidrug efflux system)